MMASEDSLYQENLAYQYSSQHQPLWHQEQTEPSVRTPPTVSSASSSVEQTRSIPIAIVRPTSGRPDNTQAYESDDDEDDNEGVIDVVERDARRLRKKYGDRVIAASYQPGLAESSTDILAKTMLKAPYLGSLSRSQDYLTSSLPPIKLSEDVFGPNEEPPSEITSYGSLRESHQRGKFLDGPSSYREPTSGQVRQLNRGFRYRSSDYSSSQPQPLSIGERIQQSRKLKEIQQTNLKKEGEPMTEAVASSLSAMMSKASEETNNNEKEKAALDHFQLYSATTTNASTNSFVSEGLHDSDLYDPPNMMSTSLTAFEILSSKNRSRPYQHNHSQRFAQQHQEQQQQHHYHHQQIQSTILPPEAPGIGATILPLQEEVRENGFKPLARSLSDPTPHHLQRSPLMSPTLEQLNSPHSALAPANPGTAWVPAYSIGGMDPQGTAYGYPTTGGNSNSMVSAENPDTDAAFDMDME